MASFEIVRGAVGRARVKAHWFAVTMVFMSRIGKSRTLRPSAKRGSCYFVPTPNLKREHLGGSTVGLKNIRTKQSTASELLGHLSE